MKDDLDAWADQLQDDIYKEAKAEYSEEVYQRWRNPKLMGRLDPADAVGSVKGQCGDSMEIFLRVHQGRVVESRFMTDGCGPSICAGSMVAGLAMGKSLEDAADSTGDLVLNALGGLPEDSEHCAGLAASALSAAVDDFFSEKA